MLDCPCHLSHHGWWGVQSNIFQTNGPSGIGLMEQITSLLFHMILQHASTIRWVPMFIMLFIVCNLQSFPSLPWLPFHSEVVCVTIVLTFPGRKGYWAWNSSIAATCYIGPNFWTGESCLSEGGFHHYSTLCSSAENASSLDFPWHSTLNLRLLPGTFLWHWEWPWGRILCKVAMLFKFEHIWILC